MDGRGRKGKKREERRRGYEDDFIVLVVVVVVAPRWRTGEERERECVCVSSSVVSGEW